MATIFPRMFAGPMGTSIMARAQETGLLDLAIHDLRDHTTDRHRTVDDYPYGGGAGMVMRPQPFFAFMDRLLEDARVIPSLAGRRPRVLMMSPAGDRLTAATARRLSNSPWLAILCGHYEGVDERVREALVDEEISIGDFILTGGELPAMVVVDAVVRLLPGALGSQDSLTEESFSGQLLEYPQYTRPAEFRGYRVPEVLLSGDHA
ncbi:MAG: tRNA (guanosine(37)-N1)-methyltransferase TrmD, partial [Firmicutes bacterium RBG_13_65_8]